MWQGLGKGPLCRGGVKKFFITDLDRAFSKLHDDS